MKEKVVIIILVLVFCFGMYKVVRAQAVNLNAQEIAELNATVQNEEATISQQEILIGNLNSTINYSTDQIQNLLGEIAQENQAVQDGDSVINAWENQQNNAT